MNYLGIVNQVAWVVWVVSINVMLWTEGEKREVWRLLTTFTAIAIAVTGVAEIALREGWL